jgi:hypothetical protein
MASIRYDKVPLVIEYDSRVEKVLAYNCSLTEAADLQPAYAIGKKGAAEQTPQGARTASLSFSYTPVLSGYINRAGSPATITSRDETGVISNIDYSINFEYEPVYKLGREFPSSFLYHSASEETRISENVHETGINFTGKSEDFKLNIKSLDNNNAMSIDMTNPVLTNIQIDASAGDIAQTEKTIRSFY